MDEVTRWAEAEHPGQLEAALHDFLGGHPVEDDSELDFLQSWFLGERELPGGRTPLERYAEDGPDPRLRELAAAQAKAKLSLWRVVESNPGESIIIEPYAGGERALIASANISHAVARWDLILGRLRRDLMELWGPCRCYTASDEPGIQATLARAAARHGLDADDVDAIVRRSPAEFVNYRTPDLIPMTTEGDPVVFVNARWRTPRARAARALDKAGFLLAEPDSDPPAYGWFGSREKLIAMKPDALPDGAVTIEGSPLGMPDVVSLGTFALDADEIRYEGLSERRLDWAIGIIEDLLPRAKLIDVTTKDVDDALAERDDRPARSPQRTEAPPEAIAEVRAILTERWLSEPVPALDGLTPREAAASPASVPQLRALLRTLESHAARAPDDLMMDLDAITRELGVTA